MPTKETRVILEIERSRIEREKARFVMSKSLTLYVIFTATAIVGFVFDYFDRVMLIALILTGLLILFLGTVPYVRTVHREERRLEELSR